MLPHLFLLSDLINSEMAYANDLFIIINRIAAAYSPQNFPPPHLDFHFRLIESIFRAHKSFLSNVLIPLNPPPPDFELNAFVALLLDWLNHLIPSYHRYVSTWAGKGGWNKDDHVQNNLTLQDTLAALPWPASLPLPPAPVFPDAPYSPADTLTPSIPNQIPNHGPHASLTVFFALPFARLVYYRRLYRDLRAILPPPSPEHGLISDADNQIGLLLQRGCAQWSVEPRPPIPHPDPPPLLVQNAPKPPGLDPSPSLPTDHAKLRTSTETTLSAQAHSSSASMTDEVFDRTSPSTPLSSSSAGSDGQQAQKQRMVEVANGIFVQQEILDLERLLDTSRCLDIFTMTPKQCRLQLAPPSLFNSRTMRMSGDASFVIRPQSDPSREMVTSAGRLVLITDLLMFCEHMGPEARGEKKMWLVYPPLAGKHLRVALSPTDETEFEVLIMSKEAVRVTVATRAERDGWVHALEDAIEYGRQQPTQLQASMLRLDSRAPIRSASAHSSPSHPSLSQGVCPPRDGFRSQPLSPCSPLMNLPRSPVPVTHALPPKKMVGFHPSHQRSLSAQRLIQTAGPHASPHGPPAFGADHRAPSADGSHPPHVPPGLPDGRPPRSAGPPIEMHGRPARPGARPVHMLRKVPSAHALSTPRTALTEGLPPVPTHGLQGGPLHEDSGRVRPDGLLSPKMMDHAPIRRTTSTEPVRDQHYRPPSTAVSHQRVSGHARQASSTGSSSDGDGGGGGAGGAPVVTESILAATMRTKVFLKTSHSQWKALGSGKLHVFIQRPGNTKQLVVVGEEKGGKTIISTIVESDGVERVGRAGVAVELCGVGAAAGGGQGTGGGKTGIVYMLQMKNETSAVGLFEQLLEGSDRRLRAQ